MFFAYVAILFFNLVLFVPNLLNYFGILHFEQTTCFVVKTND